MNSAKRVFSVAVAGIGIGLLCAVVSCTKEEPKGLPKFSVDQVKELEQAAQAGDPSDKYKLGKKFEDGDAVPQNLTNAVLWYRKAADAGHAKAQYHLGLAYEEGQGVTRDLAEAAKWFTKAAEQDNAKAQEKIGFLCWKGEGTTKNLVEAYKWLSLALANGERKAAKGLKKLELAMTQQQIAEAKKLVAAFDPKKSLKKPDKTK